MDDETGAPESLGGSLLIAMPGMTDPRFAHSIVYLCAHSEDGAMGLIVNKRVGDLSFGDLLGQLSISASAGANDIVVHFGGPVETQRGFILHSADMRIEEATQEVRDGVCLTATVDMLRAMAEGRGPRRSMLALGYAGWAPGQLESEIQANGWLHCPADEDLLFGEEDGEKWENALRKIGVDPSLLSASAGHA